jgi:hypothetical protein
MSKIRVVFKEVMRQQGIILVEKEEFEPEQTASIDQLRALGGRIVPGKGK